MGYYLSIVDHESDFLKSSGSKPTVINDVPAFSEKDVEALNSLIYKTYSGDLLTNIPSCKCGTLTGEYNYDEDPDIAPTCPDCFGKVSLHSDEDLKALTWIRAPIGVNALMNPQVWNMLSDLFKSGTFNTLQWICDPYYRPPLGTSPKILTSLEMLGVKRGFNNFINNFDSIIDALMSLKVTTASRNANRNKVNFLQRFLRENRKKIFSKYLPIPHNSLLVVEEHNSGSYVDAFTPQAINAIQTLAGIDLVEPDKDETSIRLRESRTVSAISGLGEYYRNMNSERIARKEGLFRKQGFACRSHFSFRAVVSSITKRHHYRQIEIPWGVGVSVFRIHLCNKLMTLGFTPDEAIGFLNYHAKKFHPLLNKLFKELISESSDKRGINCTINRNPSLQRGSMQSVFIRRVRGEEPGEVDIPTVGISILIIKKMNCDALFLLVSA